jgi:hypothetical protein
MKKPGNDLLSHPQRGSWPGDSEGGAQDSKSGQAAVREYALGE